MSVWLKGSIHNNPYYRTAFRLTRVEPEVMRHKTTVQLIGQTRKIVRSAPGHHQVAGTEVSEAELNQAEKVLLDPALRLAEELLHHPACPSAEKPLRDLAVRAEKRLAELAAESPTLRDYGWLADFFQHGCARFLESERPLPVAAGPLELNSAPPLGPKEEEGGWR